MAVLHHVDDVHEFTSAPGLDPGSIAQQRVLASYPDERTHIVLWMTQGGRFGSDGSAFAETFVVLSGEATITLEGEEPIALREGSVMTRPLGVPNVLDIPGPFKKVTTVVLAPKSA